MSVNSFDIDFVDLFKKSTVQRFMVLVREIAKEREVNVPDSEVLLTFV